MPDGPIYTKTTIDDDVTESAAFSTRIEATLHKGWRLETWGVVQYAVRGRGSELEAVEFSPRTILTHLPGTEEHEQSDSFVESVPWTVAIVMLPSTLQWVTHLNHPAWRYR